MYFDLIITKLISNYIKLNLLYVRTRSQVGPTQSSELENTNTSTLSRTSYTGVTAGVTAKVLSQHLGKYERISEVREGAECCCCCCCNRKMEGEKLS